MRNKDKIITEVIKKRFWKRYFDWWIDIDIADGIVPTFWLILIPLAVWIISVITFKGYPLFWWVVSITTIILGELIYGSYVKSEKKKLSTSGLIGYKIGGLFGALQIIGSWFMLPYWISRLFIKIPYTKIWKPLIRGIVNITPILLMIVGVIGLISFWLWINVKYGERLQGGKK